MEGVDTKEHPESSENRESPKPEDDAAVRTFERWEAEIANPDTFRLKEVGIRLRDYQMEAIRHFYDYPRTLFAHVMGSGKTLEAIVCLMLTLLERADSGKVGCRALIVVPASLLTQWIGEIMRYLAIDPYFIHKLTPKERPPTSAVIVLASIDTMRRVKYDIECDIVVVDEVHRFNNAGTLSAVALNRVIKLNPEAAVLFLSGTPATGRTQSAVTLASLITRKSCDVLFEGDSPGDVDSIDKEAQ